VTFRIATHSGHAAPAEAIELLWQRLSAGGEGARFARVGAEIRATWSEDEPIWVERDEREGIGRHAVLNIVYEVCASAPELESDWFAISPLR
jgi:hypothetical protein